tara:strand:- start:233 stop:913 length:681 start_codon:yes stop_codon:yes gene_type:complete
MALLISQDAVAATKKRVPVTANVALTTDYIWRGLTQTSRNPAISGGFDYAHESGFYAGTWASNVEFGNNDNAESQELEGYFGYTHKINDSLGVTLGYIYYDYPGAKASNNYDFQEGVLSATYTQSDMSVTVGVNYSDNFWGGSGDATFVNGSVSYNVDDHWSVSGSLGRQSIDNNAAFGAADYNVGTVSVTYAFDDVLSATAGLSKTDLSGESGDTNYLLTISASI